MLNQDFANRCVREELESQYENSTLREFLSSYFGGCGIDNDDIEEAMTNEYVDLIDAWAANYDLDYTEMFEFLMRSLDLEVEYDIKIDMNYDEKPIRMGSDAKPFWNKEVRFEGNVLVGGILLSLDEWFKDFEVSHEEN